MTLPKQRFSDGWLLPGFALAFLAAVVAFAMMPYGSLRFTYDSFDILGASESLDTYLTGKNKDGHSYLVRAPLHPFLLSFFHDKVLAFWWINFLSLLGSLILIFQVCRNCKLTIKVSILVVMLNALFIPWLLNFQFAWTEPLFIAMLLLLCYVLQRDASFMLVLAVCVLLFMIRKSGLFLFVGVAVYYVTQKKNREAVATIIASGVIFVALEWLEFTYGSTGFFPEWLLKLESYSRVYYLDAFTSWLLPLKIPLVFRAPLVLIFVSAVLYFYSTEIFQVSRQKQNVVLLIIAMVYSVILISFRGVSEYEDAERYLTVLFPLLIIFGASFVVEILKKHSGTVRILVVAVLAMWVFYLFLRLVHYLHWPVV